VIQPFPKMTFVLGGARSGKSLYAEQLVTAQPGPWCYIATAQGFDAEMLARIADHQRRRASDWVTLDAPLDLIGTLRSVPPGRPTLVDCLTLWLTNVMLDGRHVEQAMTDLVNALASLPGPCVMVSNEVGLGIVPDNALARAFRDHAGRLHQRVAAHADRVVFMVAGLPMVVK
jgi:adenosylcobinamide kinase / adenosylcobinamide-phosphate guanylyltransferase